MCRRVKELSLKEFEDPPMLRGHTISHEMTDPEAATLVVELRECNQRGILILIIRINDHFNGVKLFLDEAWILAHDMPEFLA